MKFFACSLSYGCSILCIATTEPSYPWLEKMNGSGLPPWGKKGPAPASMLHSAYGLGMQILYSFVCGWPQGPFGATTPTAPKLLGQGTIYEGNRQFSCGFPPSLQRPTNWMALIFSVAVLVDRQTEFRVLLAFSLALPGGTCDLDVYPVSSVLCTSTERITEFV